MKGKMRKLFALALAAIMVLAMGITASATGNEGIAPQASTETATITIVSPINGETYTAYKIFDVKTTKVGGEDVASYTRKVALPETVTVPTTLFEVVNNGGEIYYNAKANIVASELEAFLKTVVEANGALTSKSTTVSVDSETGAISNNVISGLEPGYYYVKSTAGQAAMLRAIAGGNTNITEKNTQSGWGDGGKKSYRKVWNDANNNEVEDEGEVTYVEDIVYAIGDTVNYVITYNNAQNFDTVTKDNGDGTTTTTTTKNHQYVVKDVMPAGVTINVSSVKITVTEANGKGTEHILTKAESGREIDTYTGSILPTGFDIVIPWASSDNAAIVEDFHYKNVPAEIKIEYSATVTGTVAVDSSLTNTVRISPNQLTNTDTEKKENKIYTGSLQVRKYDGTDTNTTWQNALDIQKLTGAQFVIIKDAVYDEATAQYLKKDTTTGFISWTSVKKEATTLTTTNGLSEVLSGLDEGTYYLLETVAPQGYNLLATPVEVIVTVDSAAIEAAEEVLNSSTADDDQKNVARENITNAFVTYSAIANSRGTLLPSTGGIGTTIFYVVGGILVAVAGILLITKKRMSGRD